jgi:hypothetical protein
MQRLGPFISRKNSEKKQKIGKVTIASAIAHPGVVPLSMPEELHRGHNLGATTRRAGGDGGAS